uniref:Uncharacterized protein n=1 Tax=Sipha flava TaxID=143950 RepID=A0A2S2R7Z5_9HEMI
MVFLFNRFFYFITSLVKQYSTTMYLTTASLKLQLLWLVRNTITNVTTIIRYMLCEHRSCVDNYARKRFSDLKSSNTFFLYKLSIVIFNYTLTHTYTYVCIHNTFDIM